MIIELVRVAARALRANAFRSSLTVLSITIGAFAIVFMSSLAASGLLTLKRGIEEIGGARLLFIVPKKPERARDKASAYQPGLDRELREDVLGGVTHVVERAGFASLGRRNTSGNQGDTTRTDLVAADHRFLDTFRMRVGRGRGVSDEDVAKHAPVCVIGNVTADRVFRGDPIGKMLTIGALRCRIVGVLADNKRFGTNFGFDWVDLVVAPYTTVAEVEPGIDEELVLIAKTDDSANNEIAKRVVNALMVERRHGVDDFTIYDFCRMMEKFENLFAIMEAIVALIAGVALVIGGVGVTNMMLVSVSERVREIGIRRALGARPNDVGAQFLIEAILLSSAGGFVGAALGVLLAIGASLLIRHGLSTWVTTISGPAVVAAVTVTLGVGIVCGLLPARRAALLAPVEAMRS